MNKDLFDQIAAVAYSSRETLMKTYNHAETQGSILFGDFMECGVGAGAQLGAMAAAMALPQCKDSARRLYALDSYEGIPLAGINDDQQPGIGYFDPALPRQIAENRLVSSGVTVHGLDTVKQNLSTWGLLSPQIEFVQGWFENTAEPLAERLMHDGRKLSLLRLDGDLYDSTMVCLQHFFPLLQISGLLIVDDYALQGCRKACLQYFDRVKPDLDNLGLVLNPVEVCEGPSYFRLEHIK